MCREIALVNLWGQEVAPMFGNDGAVAWSESHPSDVGAALRAVLSVANHRSNESEVPTLDELEARFPHETWLPAFREANARELSTNFTSLSPPSSTALALRQRLLAGAKREPDNAFWIVALACWEWNFASRRMVPRNQVRIFRATYYWPTAPTSATAPPRPVAPGTVLPTSPNNQLVPDDESVLRHILTMLLSTRHYTRYDDGVWQAMSALNRADTRRLGWPLEKQVEELDDSAGFSQQITLIGVNSVLAYALGLLQPLPSPTVPPGKSLVLSVSPPCWPPYHRESGWKLEWRWLVWGL